MKRKAISCLLVLASVLTMTPSIPTLAAENQAGETMVNETLADENQADKTLADETQTGGTSTDGLQDTNASGSKAAVVKYDQASSFTVTIPKSIVLDSNKAATYNVKVKGDVLGNEIITVVPDATVTLNDANGKDPVTGNIAQEKTEFSSTEVNQIDGTKTNGNIAANDLTSGDWSGNFEFAIGTNKIGNGIVITSENLATYGIKTTEDVVIPEYVTDNDNTRHAVTSISDYAFRDCDEMTSVSIADSVTEIGTGAFANCSKLSNVSLPSALKTVKSNIFEGCSNLSAIQYKENSYDKTDIGSALTENNVTVDSELFEHTYGEPTYVWSEDGQTCTAKRTCVNHPSAVETEEATISSTVKEAATCTTKGTTTYTATFKDTVFVTQTKDIQDIAIVNHNYVNNVCTVCNAKEPGLYNANGAMLCTWEESGINVASDYTADTYKTDAGSPYYVITNSYPATTNVVIPDSVEKIGSYSFDECKALTSVNIPDSITNIGECAFINCSSLTSITIPQNVITISNGAFKDCTSLTNVVFEENSALQTLGREYPTSDKYYYGVFQGCTSLQSIEIPDSITSTGDATFRDCTALETVHLPTSIKKIGRHTFKGCSLLTNITIPNNVTSIGNYAFNSCSSLISITIPDSVTSIGTWAFCSCSGLTSITIPRNVNNIGSGTFKDCTSLANVVFEENSALQTLGEEYPTSDRYYYGTFQGCTSLKSIEIPDSVTSAGDATFKDCSAIETVHLPNSLTKVRQYAFYGCSGLKSIAISDSVTSIGDRAFYNCKGLTSITIPDDVTSIGEYAFSGCSGLTSITIPENVTNIGEYTFSDCSSLTNIAMSDNITCIETSAFRKCTSLTSITIPASVTSIGTNTFGYCSSLASVVFEENSALQTLGSEHTDPNRSYYGAFQDCASLKSIEIPDSVTSIGEFAFGNTGLTSITIPNSVTSIGEYAFQYCEKLTSVTYKGQEYTSKSALTTDLTDNNVTLGKDIFYGAALTN